MSSNLDNSRRFTATWQPTPTYKSSTWANACLWGEQAPIHPPFRFTDQSLIPVIIRIPRSEVDSSIRSKKTSRGLVGLLRGTHTSKSASDITVIRMPRSEYLRYFARDKNNKYIGTEPERRWTEQDLEEEFGVYQDLPPPHWEMKESDGRVFMEESHVWGEKEEFRSSHVTL
ncbi:hypothetical protein BKA61DRAFT_578247 [Leptodontidium sp. MPI-SDFR-AT-0119]|nr:hypothetical protein BKA61DRAFT_578247 [Leptodontidium sp. MPI-SDFR-AT-0119]